MSSVLRVPAYLGVGLVYAYRYTFGVALPRGLQVPPDLLAVRDRLAPGVRARSSGVILAGWRLLRCNPWSLGGVDYAEQQRLFH